MLVVSSCSVNVKVQSDESNGIIKRTVLRPSLTQGIGWSVSFGYSKDDVRLIVAKLEWLYKITGLNELHSLPTLIANSAEKMSRIHTSTYIMQC